MIGGEKHPRRQSQSIQSFQRALNNNLRKVDELKVHDPPSNLMSSLASEPVVNFDPKPKDYQSQLHLEYAKVLMEEKRKNSLPLGLKHGCHNSSPPNLPEKISQNSSMFMNPKNLVKTVEIPAEPQD